MRIRRNDLVTLAADQTVEPGKVALVAGTIARVWWPTKPDRLYTHEVDALVLVCAREKDPRQHKLFEVRP